MNKKFLSLAIAAISLIGATACAQSSTDTNAQTPTEQCEKGKKGDRPGREMRDPFAGLDLTAEQRSALDALRPAKPADGQRPDGPAPEAKEQREKLTPEQRAAERDSMRADYLAKVKQILTPEQYTKFLENNVQIGDKKGGRDMKRGDRKPRGNGDTSMNFKKHGGKKGQKDTNVASAKKQGKAQKGQKTQKPQTTQQA
ncbi:MAG: hypothetical protein LIO90_11160 [Bacteroidales bacterium]|nr:hypothetical protein [Bacteroidales bacterium]